jgi:hypothetical protein
MVSAPPFQINNSHLVLTMVTSAKISSWHLDWAIQ